jgi:hypothetical protein
MKRALIDEAEPRRHIRRCPAVILAVSRIAKVKGRIILLNLSMRTRKGIRGAGVLIGTKWQAILLNSRVHPTIWIPNQIGMDRKRVITR